MPSEFPRSPWLLKGALVVFEAKRPIPTNLIVFQYNPDSMSRSLRQEIDWSNWPLSAQKKDILPPTESFQLEVELDAADQLETSNVMARTVGLHPTLAALELLLYPQSKDRLLAQLAGQSGQVIVASKPPLVLLVWGAPRIVPVAVTSLSITEEAFDQFLNPIRARVSLGLDALSDADLAETSLKSFGLLRHRSKELLAQTAVFAGAGEIRGMLPI